MSIVGRIKELIIKGGENIYPREIEIELAAHPDILEVHVFGIPDQLYGEQVCCWVKLKDPDTVNAPSADEIRQFLKDRIAYFKIPKHVFLVSDFPLTYTGKASKRLMAAKTVELLKQNFQ